MTRAKFRCTEISKKSGWGDNSSGFVYDAKFQAVYGDGSKENETFFAATPSGNITLSTLRADHFKVGQMYYVDFTEAG